MKAWSLITELFQTLTDRANKSSPEHQEDMKEISRAIERTMLALRHDNADQSADVSIRRI